LKTHWKPQRRLRWLLPIGAVASTLALLFGSTAPAYAAGYRTTTYGFYDEDPDGSGAAAIIRWHNDAGGSVPRYQAHFYPNGEMLVVRDDYADGHAAKVIVGVYDGSDLIDSDLFYVGTAETGKSINLGTPDGTGNIKDGLRVTIKLCINETSVCTDTVNGRA
jgi:hypothetical protein